MLASHSAQFLLKLAGDTSPGVSSYVFNLTTGDSAFDLRVPAPLPSPWPSTSDYQLVLTLGPLQADTSYEVRVWSINQVRYSLCCVCVCYTSSFAILWLLCS